MRVAFNQVSFQYPEKKILKNASFGIKPGEIFCLVGRSGSGKSTIIDLLLGYQTPQKGKIVMDTNTVVNEVPQADALYDHFTVRQNIQFFSKLWSRSTQGLSRYIESLGLKPLTDQQVDTLSGGQKRRVSFLLGLLGNPNIICLDEPTTGLDPHTKRDLWDITRKVAEEGVGILLVTHMMDDVSELSDRVGFLRNGSVTVVNRNTLFTDELPSIIQIKTTQPDVIASKILYPYKIHSEGVQITVTQSDVLHVLKTLYPVMSKVTDIQIQSPSMKDAYRKYIE